VSVLGAIIGTGLEEPEGHIMIGMAASLEWRFPRQDGSQVWLDCRIDLTQWMIGFGWGHDILSVYVLCFGCTVERVTPEEQVTPEEG
jgi:hypothetical protein